MTDKRKRLLRLLAAVVGLCVLAGLAALGLSAYVRQSVKDRMISKDALSGLDADCILVLGAAIWENDTPCPMLADRLDYGIMAYEAGASERVIVSGDHRDPAHDETSVMKRYCISSGVPSEAVFMDHEGYSTFESLLRARDVFGVEKVLIVTQEYHLYRALYIARQLGLEAYGYASDPRSYMGQTYRLAREVLARDKDFFQCRNVREAGEPLYDLNRSGDVTNDAQYLNR